MTLLTLPEESVFILRKCLSRTIPTAAHGSVFSRLGADSLRRRMGEPPMADTSEGHCVVLQRRGPRLAASLRGWSERGCPVWFDLEVVGAMSVPTLGLDPAALYLNRTVAAVTLDRESAGAVRTASCRQGDVLRRVRLLTATQSDGLALSLPRGRPKSRDEVTLSGPVMRALRRISLISGITDHPAWLTLISDAQGLSAVWEGGNGIVCCVRDPIRLEKEFTLRLSPGAVRLLRWALSLAGTYEHMESLTLDAGERGGVIRGNRSGVSSIGITFGLEEDAYRSPKMSDSEANGYLSRTRESLKDPALRTLNINSVTLAQSLATAASFLRAASVLTPNPGVSLGHSGTSPHSLLVQARGDRSLRLSPEGIPASAPPSVLMSPDSAGALARLIRIYASAEKAKDTAFRSMRSEALEGVSLGEDAGFSFLVRRDAGIRTTFSRDSSVEARTAWRTDPALLPKAERMLALESLPLVRQASAPSPACLGPGLGCLVAFQDGRVVLASGALNLLTRCEHPAAGAQEYLLVPHGELLAAVTALRRVQSALSDKPRSLTLTLQKGKGGHSLDVDLSEEGRSLATARVPHVTRVTAEEATALVGRNAGPKPDTAGETWDSRWALPLRRLLESCTLDRMRAGQQSGPMALLRECHLSDGSLWASDRTSVLRTKPPPVRLTPRKSLLALSEVLNSPSVRESAGTIEVSGDGVSARLSEGSLSDYPVDKLRTLLVLEPAVSAKITAEALLELLTGDGPAVWAWHRSGQYQIAGETRQGVPTLWTAGDVFGVSVSQDRLRQFLTRHGDYLESLGLKAGEVTASLTATKVLLSGDGWQFLLGAEGAADADHLASLTWDGVQ